MLSSCRCVYQEPKVTTFARFESAINALFDLIDTLLQNPCQRHCGYDSSLKVYRADPHMNCSAYTGIYHCYWTDLRKLKSQLGTICSPYADTQTARSHRRNVSLECFFNCLGKRQMRSSCSRVHMQAIWRCLRTLFMCNSLLLKIKQISNITEAFEA
jgi:hypothetical protein